jgi:FixJ family two-component response regulator
VLLLEHITKDWRSCQLIAVVKTKVPENHVLKRDQRQANKVYKCTHSLTAKHQQVASLPTKDHNGKASAPHQHAKAQPE